MSDHRSLEMCKQKPLRGGLLIMWLLKEAAAESKYSGSWGLGGQGFEVQRMARGSLDTRLSPQHKTCRPRMNNKVL